MEARSIAERSDGRSEPPERELDVLRSRLHGMWGGVAGGWAEHADFVAVRGAEMTERLLDLAAPVAGERVLELASGPGDVGLAAAGRVAPGGEVVVSDVAAEMTSIAAARARARGLDNVATRELDIEKIDEPDGSYDVVLCREGLMLVPDPERAAQEIRRILRLGGRVALSVWGPRERNPWLGNVLDSVSAQLGAPVPPPGIPGPFSLDDPDRLASLLSGAGLTGVEVSELPVPYRAGSFEEWWTRTCALAGPLAQVIAALPEPATKALRDRARDASAAYGTADGLEFPGVALIASASRPI
jgi:SAM-dependent methyltransferase